jgi:hypothetical protein
MLVISTDTMPPGVELVESLGLMEVTAPIQISAKKLAQALFQKNRNEHQDVFDQFVNSAPDGANIIYGVKVSTATAVFNEGTFLFLTYIGTAGRAKGV